MKREKEIIRIRGTQMDNLRDLLGIERIDRFSNAWIRTVWGYVWNGLKRLNKGFYNGRAVL